MPTTTLGRAFVLGLVAALHLPTKASAAEESAKIPPELLLETKKSMEDATKALEKATKAMEKIAPATTKDSTFLNIELFTGAKLQNPYKITTTNSTATLDPNKSTTQGFVELNLFIRNVFKTGIYDETDYTKGTNTESTNHAVKAAWVFGERAGRYMMPDFDLRVGYAFGNSRPDKLEISTIAGGSDLYLEGSIGQPIVRLSNRDNWQGQVTLELGGGFTTDDSFNKVHPNLFAGAGFQMAYTPVKGPGGLGNTYVLLRFGYASFDEPVLTTAPSIKVDAFGLPEFEQSWAPSVGTTLIFKLSTGFSLQLTSNVYFAERASWNLSAGISVDPSKFLPK